ncbi:MAG: hemolysin family protein [Lentisphaeria bacterium]|jgi:CBS domain containing-hemolysin-like protein
MAEDPPALWICAAYGAAVVVLLALSAAFSAAETALFSLAPTQVRRLSRRPAGRADRAVVALLKDPSGLLTTVLVGNNLVNILLASVVAAFCRQFLRGHGILAAIAVSSLLLILFGEVLPKTVAAQASLPLARMLAIPLHGLSRACRPIRWLLHSLLSLACRATGRRQPPEWGLISREKIAAMLAHGHEAGATSAHARELAENILRLPLVTARELAVPRTEVKGAPDSLTLAEAFDLACRCRHSRLPVYHGNLDQIWGFIQLAELPRWRNQPEARLRLRTFRPRHPGAAGGGQPGSPVQPVLVIPEQARVETLLEELRRRAIGMAVIVDEFGGTAGILTDQDIRGEILGKLAPGNAPLHQVEGELLLADGQASLRDLRRELNLRLPDTDADTVGGLIMANLGRLPRAGDAVEVAGHRLTVIKMAGRRVGAARIQFLAGTAPWRHPHPPQRPASTAGGAP